MTTANTAVDPLNEELLTQEEFAEVHFNEVVELVDGKVQLMGNNNPDHSEVLLNLGSELRVYVRKKKLGKVYGGDVTVIIRRDPDTSRGIDLAYVSHQTLQEQPAGVSALQVAPELAIEIMSPSNPWDDVLKKVSEYFEIGVQEVWVISMSIRGATVFKSLTEMQGYTLANGDSLSCPEILPGFEIALGDVFEGLPDLEG